MALVDHAVTFRTVQKAVMPCGPEVDVAVAHSRCGALINSVS